MFRRRSARSHLAPARRGPAPRPSARMRASRGAAWLQLLLGIVCMALVANLQYGWALFVGPIDQKTHWGQAEIAGTLTVFVLAQSWLMPLHGWFVDRFGPRIPVLTGGILAGAAWTLDAFAVSPHMLVIAAALGGAGTGAVYGTVIGNAIKWFADWRGFAVGLTAAAFGLGATASAIPIRYAIEQWGYETALLAFGLGLGAVLSLLALFLRTPDPEEVASTRAVQLLQSPRQYSPLDMLASPVFWSLYAIGILVCTGGLLATAQIVPAARALGIADEPATLLGLSLPVLGFMLSLEGVPNAAARPVFGLLSDLIGREFTLFAAFGLEASAILALSEYGHSPSAFVLLAGLVVFGWGAVYSLVPALCGDIFGSKYAATNAGILFTSLGVATLLLPRANALVATSGGVHTAFILAVVLNLTAALAAILILRPARLDLHTRSFVSLTGPKTSSAAPPVAGGSGGGSRLGLVLGACVAAALAAYFLLPGREAPRPASEAKEQIQVIVAVPVENNGIPQAAQAARPASPVNPAPAGQTGPAAEPTPEAVPPAKAPEAGPAPAVQAVTSAPSSAPAATAPGSAGQSPAEKPAASPARKMDSANKKEKKKKKFSASQDD